MIILQNSGVPIYRQIADDFRTRILNGEIKAGEFLRSRRGRNSQCHQRKRFLC